MTVRRNSLSIGKEGELRVIGELLRQGFMVYIPVVDTEGTDCIIKNKTTFIGIQVKTRESAQTLLWDVKRFKPRDNFFIVCYSTKEPNDFWVLPSRVYAEYARPVNKKTKLRLVLGDDGSRMRQRLHIYRNNFHQLRNIGEIAARSEDRRAVKQTSKRVTGWARLKRLYPTVEAVETKIKQASASGVSPGYLKILENLKRYWSRRRPSSP